MSKSKAELSVSARMLLDYITFRTKNHYPFFEKNETIAFKLDLTPGTVKELINRLVREGYLFKCKDEYNRRQLIITEQKHKPLYYPLQDINKDGLKKELEYKTKELENAERQIDECMAKIQELKDANISKQQKVIELEKEIAELKATNNVQDQCRYVKPTQELEYPKAQELEHKQQCYVPPITMKPLQNDNDMEIVRVSDVSVGMQPQNPAYDQKSDHRALIDGIMSKYRTGKYDSNMC